MHMGKNGVWCISKALSLDGMGGTSGTCGSDSSRVGCVEMAVSLAFAAIEEKRRGGREEKRRGKMEARCKENG